MDWKSLRNQYPVFSFDKFESDFSGNVLNIKFFYSLPPKHHFVHELSINLPASANNSVPQFESLIFNLGLSLMLSYWKLTCSPVIKLPANHGHLNSQQIKFWTKLILNGMGEYFYKNQIDFTPTDFVTIEILDNQPPAFISKITHKNDDWTLIPLGGGKDSIVTLELIKSAFPVTAFAINPHPIISQITRKAGVNLITVNSRLDPHLLELNQKDFLNGHVPVSAFYSFCAVLTAQLLGITNVAFSNEASSNEGNVEYLGHQINHQYSKSLEFETDMHQYLLDLKLDLNYFSFLRPLFELQITQLFCRYPEYFDIFTSCNQNFKLDSHQPSLWCQKCPKCISTSLMMSCFMDKQKIAGIMGSYPPDLPDNQKIMDQLLGNAEYKPFECVLSQAEAQAAFAGHNLNQLLSAWHENPNLPEKFASILKAAINST
ncbi:hypothetical protein A2397_04750 [Candidatus Amesbacteria bacterium RIFOXYB1_FULL_44_23]|uniref:UDP-N-acetyl-alpha-D-muramoyl-L-alanyl-L-glutamate epimerase n=1 Tax=Candidatus Amesbacteria bacterium RIFOXYB1_FULL_44_23 TaxID=1797263 RepID=A0A1F4ZTU1_9BACT|nr:MAG: hypothetical protein A2397_04750 [Candidatus Amesbacteria bacterium RIFOXYB1_FULL_44_23]